MYKTIEERQIARRISKRKYKNKMKALGKWIIPNRKKKSRLYRAKYPERTKANAAVKWAVYHSGKLIKPKCCCVCKKETEVIAHHDDYSKPLDVMWVCQNCHNDIHGRSKIED